MENQNQNAIAQSMFGVFGKKAEDVKVKDESTGSSIFFNPDAKSAPNQTYRAVIKFLPKLYDLENPNKTETVETVSYWIPEGNGGLRYTSPKSIGKNENCIVANKYWAWKSSEDARLKLLPPKLSYKRQFFALIQVIADYAKPENNGKIFLYDAPYAIQKKMNALMYPSAEDVKMGAEANNIFDPLNGQCLVMKVPIKVTDAGEFRDYDECNFNEKMARTMIVDFDDKDNLKQAEKPETEAALESYKNKAIQAILDGPSLKEVEYKPASEETLKRISNALSILESGSPAETVTTYSSTVNTSTDSATSTSEAKTGQQPTTTAQTTTSATQSAEDLVKQVMGNQG